MKTKRLISNKQQWLVDREFVELVHEIAFGDSAIDKDYSNEEVLVRLNEFAHESNHTAKDLATWIQKEIDKTAVTNPDGSDGMSDGELLDYIYDTCKKITEGGQA
tara:strand:- start:220 stop:534 length:315 start_codon:yes stop_codon:yes gene_type:complete